MKELYPFLYPEAKRRDASDDGLLESVRQKGAEAVVTESSLIEITSLHRASEMTHAKPVE